ncbi:MAG TPA: AAA family ATPase [Caldisericia bacterium]|jgi:predicted kinase|nr:AAA family ATPase [Caldisericia bacterium]
MSIGYILIGLPGSGKSYWSLNKIKTESNLVCICRDKIREMLKVDYLYWPFFTKDSKKYTKLETTIADYTLDLSLQKGFDVIIDSTHIIKRTRKNTVDKLRKYDCDIRYVWFTENQNNLQYRLETPKNESLDLNYWEKVISSMKNRFEEPNLDEIKSFKINKFYKVSREHGEIEITI